MSSSVHSPEIGRTNDGGLLAQGSPPGGDLSGFQGSLVAVPTAFLFTLRRGSWRASDLMHLTRGRTTSRGAENFSRTEILGKTPEVIDILSR